MSPSRSMSAATTRRQLHVVAAGDQAPENEAALDQLAGADIGKRRQRAGVPRTRRKESTASRRARQRSCANREAGTSLASYQCQTGQRRVDQSLAAIERLARERAEAEPVAREADWPCRPLARSASRPASRRRASRSAGATLARARVRHRRRIRLPWKRSIAAEHRVVGNKFAGRVHRECVAWRRSACSSAPRARARAPAIRSPSAMPSYRRVWFSSRAL